MKREWLLAVVPSAVAVVAALALVRWLAPGLLGYAVDQQLVQVSREVPPFYENVFRDEDYASSSFLLNDPVLVSRAKPLYPDVLAMGPNDILGFRNRSVPNQAHIVTIGDSQTYGNNAALENNWPSHLERALYGDGPERIYNMSVGAWGGVNYLAILDSALRFRPKAVIVAFYTGNDPFSDFRNAYTMDELSYLRPDPELTTEDLPKGTFPVPPEDIIEVEFADGVTTAFTPRYRHVSNDRAEPAVMAGYEIMWRTAREINERLVGANVQAVFTIIPTKEYVYARKVESEGIEVGAAYQRLVADEARNAAELAGKLAELPGARYVDVIGPLQGAAMGAVALYPTDENGHPLARGYSVIADALGGSIERSGVTAVKGLAALVSGQAVQRFVLLTDEGLWWVPSRDTAYENGWDLSDIPTVPIEQVSAMRYLGALSEVDPARFGPQAFD